MTNKEIQIKVVQAFHAKGGREAFEIMRDCAWAWESFWMHVSDDEIIDAIIAFIFSHDFARCFWGEKRLQTSLYVPEEAGMFGISVTKSMPAWMFHLQEMVLEKEPLKYLEKFL